MLLWLAGALVGCGETPPPKVEPHPEPKAAPAPPPAPAVPEWKILAPSPLQLEAEVKKAGVAETLADLVPTTPPPAPPADEKDRVAFRTGVVFAYTLLGGRTAEKATLVANVKSLRDGMATIGTGEGLLSTMDKATVQLENDTASRSDFLVELDAQVSSSVPEEGWGPTDTTGPLLQAGAWLAGTNVVAKAVVRKNDPAAAQALLHRPEVAAFFLKYIKSDDGTAKAGMMTGKVADTLKALETTSGKPHLDVADAQAIVDATDALLKLL